MNDFTKEELEFIFEHTKFSIDYNKVINAPMTILIDKIQSMIDNYCEHEWQPGGNRPGLHCIRCKANFYHEGLILNEMD